ncbi:GNAT family N-acetyltransferase [Chromobacterium violaceum]|uniref:N-acetyltransferase n=3 Tax=Chromobacterium violaceum TaxID=536 RepID=A0A202B5Z6_CHRVL|nr:GNAT family N-acetyltransferase [Chromobacterium violaceum]AAQ60460.1 probable acetyltransferase [Chromobacterium violaceum ATCC 12472]ATP30720.1 N-acetyltransferase [Chromobacterium violaceum]ATP34628.1 N-acetyltransferase [Chromobacterium violaceum]KMN51736.1 GCN5 family acetyltransferase [Chromobacterium violaceum]KMN84727.1 GCN5 family acetyltransferase [Chromobacterium violaceum]
MQTPELFICDQAAPEAEKTIAAGLNQYNDQHTGYADRQPLAVLARDPATGETLGGAYGRSSLGLLFLELFHLPEPLRGQGLGSRILQAFEDEGRRRGCRHAVLYTISFQAPGFYQRHGWQVFGEIPCDPPGASRIFLRKAL